MRPRTAVTETATRNWSVYGGVTRELAELVATLAAAGERRLPPEDELGTRLGVSRPTIRSALQELESQGQIRRQHGRGTFINSHALGLAVNVAQDRTFIDILTDLGYTPRIRVRGLRAAELTREQADRLGLDAPEPACVVERRYDASGKPAILVVDVVPQRFLPRPPGQLTAEDSTFDFINRHTGRSVSYSVASIRPVLADERVRTALRLAADSPVLMLDHLHIDQDDRAVALTDAYINDRYLRFSVVRTR
ncbi:MAG TPA: GntR family transcriptional regulator [Nakamurella sp.]|nr:GntR family transcriptional regulator [Nakamurella sp.]